MSFQQFLLILHARRRLVIRTLLLVVIATVAASLILPKRYTATASVVVDTNAPDPVQSSNNTLVTGPQPSYMPTQLDIAGSDRVAQRVVGALKLQNDPEWHERWMKATEGEGSEVVWMGEQLLRKLKVKLGKDSDVIAISFKSPDPQFSAAVANAFARAYIATNIELRTGPAKQSVEWFEEQGKVLRAQLENAQARISKYQQEHGIVATDEKLDSETARLADLTSQMTLAQGQTAESRSRIRAGESAATLPEVMQNPMIQQMKATIAAQEGKIKDASGNWGPNYPALKRMIAENNAMKAQLANETRKIADSLANASGSSQAKEAELRGEVADQKTKLLEMRRQRDELAVLMRDGDAAQKAYDEIAQKVTQNNLEGQVTQSNVAVLTPAVKPLKPSSPLLALNTLIAIFLGGLLGIAAAFAQEMRDRRVRSLSDLEVILDLPVLAEVRRPSRYLTARRPALGAPA
ncbi:MAG TPA: chain length determinant protein EpsF [Burkholderiales bacterium]|jgi:chain length determinant protein EpsF